jgi:hypothetical protein
MPIGSTRSVRTVRAQVPAEQALWRRQTPGTNLPLGTSDSQLVFRRGGTALHDLVNADWASDVIYRK